MTWTLAAFAVLSLSLVAGFGWYERSHPSAKVLALVATLAALAALGRIAFAPLPSVKPTTDIVLISGFTLGGAPGFAVGAVAALTSNVFFGQGPWTPWQMGAWGAVGVGGALLARVMRGRPHRIPLALACGAAGIAFGTVMNVFTWLTFSDADAGGGLVVIAGRALPFDIAHAIGNVVFFLAFGPALVSAIARFRARFEVSWRTPAPDTVARAAGPLAALALAVVLLLPSGAQAASSAGYLTAAQNADGGWGGGKGQSSAQLYTGWAALGMAAAGQNPLDVRRGPGSSPIDFIRKGAGQINTIGEVERTVLVLGAAGVDARSFAGKDLVASILARRRANGSISGQTVYTAFGIMALRASGLKTSSTAVRRAAAWLASQQNRDGGFNTYGKGGGSTIDDSGAAIQGLVAAGRRGSATSRAAAFMRRQQAASGGFPLSPGGILNAQSTSYAVLGFLAAGANPDKVRRKGGRSAMQYLRSLVAQDGSVHYSRTSAQTPVWVTAQALIALNRKTLPLAKVKRKPTLLGSPANPASSDGTSDLLGPGDDPFGDPAVAGASTPAAGKAAAGSADAAGATAGPTAGPQPTAMTRALALARAAGAATAFVFVPVSKEDL